MTKQELSQLSHLNKEIELLKLRLLDLQSGKDAIGDVVKGSMTTAPYILHSIKISDLPDDIKKEISKIKIQIRKGLKRCLEERLKAEIFIEGIPDSRLRMIFSLRYINGLSWEQVAMHISVYETEDSVRKAVDRYLKNLSDMSA